MARFLITGVAGFIGSTIAHRLVEMGHEVTGVDDLSSGVKSNIPEGVEFLPIDIRDLPGMTYACRKKDYVLHLAAVASVPASVEQPLNTHEVNVNGTLSVLLAARNTDVGRVIYSASSSAYGDIGTHPAKETMRPNPKSPYAVQKLAGELYVHSFCSTYGMKAVNLRYFNIFGARQSATSPYSGVIAHFIHKMLAGEVPTIYGDGWATRDFTFVDNVVEANLLACSAPDRFADGRVYNVGTGSGSSILHLYSMLADIIGFKEPPKFENAREGDVKFSIASIDKVVRDLGYQPNTDFKEGLVKTVEWYRGQM